MKLFLAALLGLLPLVLAAKSLKSVVVTFPEGTPSRVIDQAKDSLVAAVSCASHTPCFASSVTKQHCLGWCDYP